MKKITLLFCLLPLMGCAQEIKEIVKLQNNQKVILYDDGTWKYAPKGSSEIQSLTSPAQNQIKNTRNNTSSSRTYSPSPSYSGICGARTKKGGACKRRVSGGGTCWQH